MLFLHINTFTYIYAENIWDWFTYWDFIYKYFQTNAWIFVEIKCSEFSLSLLFFKVFFFFSVQFQFANAPYWENNFPNCSWYPLFIETSPLLFKSNLWTVGKNKLTVIDLWSSARAFQPEKSTEIALRIVISVFLVTPLNPKIFAYSFSRVHSSNSSGPVFLSRIACWVIGQQIK